MLVDGIFPYVFVGITNIFLTRNKSITRQTHYKHNKLIDTDININTYYRKKAKKLDAP